MILTVELDLHKVTTPNVSVKSVLFESYFQTNT